MSDEKDLQFPPTQNSNTTQWNPWEKMSLPEPEIVKDHTGKPKGCTVPWHLGLNSTPVIECQKKADALRAKMFAEEMEARRRFYQSDWYKEQQILGHQSAEVQQIIKRARKNIKKALQINLCPFKEKLKNHLKENPIVDFVSINVLVKKSTWPAGIIIELDMDRFGKLYIGGGAEVDVLQLIPATKAVSSLVNNVASDVYGRNPSKVIANIIPSADGTTISGSQFQSSNRLDKESGHNLTNQKYAETFLTGIEVNTGVTFFYVNVGVTHPISTQLGFGHWSLDVGMDSDFLGTGIGTNYSWLIEVDLGC